MHTQNVNTVAFESSKTWVNGEKTTISASQGQKICVSANELHTRWHAPGRRARWSHLQQGRTARRETAAMARMCCCSMKPMCWR